MHVQDVRLDQPAVGKDIDHLLIDRGSLFLARTEAVARAAACNPVPTR